MTQYGTLRSELGRILELLSGYGIQCSVSSEELLTYFSSPTYENDTVDLDEVLSNELLLLHEVAEICFLKGMGYTITRNIVVEAYPNTYYAHLKALDIELVEAEKRDIREWISRRCKDLESYLTDPQLPQDLESLIHKLINRFCIG